MMAHCNSLHGMTFQDCIPEVTSPQQIVKHQVTVFTVMRHMSNGQTQSCIMMVLTVIMCYTHYSHISCSPSCTVIMCYTHYSHISCSPSCTVIMCYTHYSHISCSPSCTVIMCYTHYSHISCSPSCTVIMCYTHYSHIS